MAIEKSGTPLGSVQKYSRTLPDVPEKARQESILTSRPSIVNTKNRKAAHLQPGVMGACMKGKQPENLPRVD